MVLMAKMLMEIVAKMLTELMSQEAQLVEPVER